MTTAKPQAMPVRMTLAEWAESAPPPNDELARRLAALFAPRVAVEQGTASANRGAA